MRGGATAPTTAGHARQLAAAALEPLVVPARAPARALGPHRAAAGPVRELPAAPADLDGLTFETSHGTTTLAGLLARSCADGFLVLHRGRIVTEQYFNGMERDTPHLLQSVSKSLVGALAGVLVGGGALAGRAAARRRRARADGTSFEGATVRHLLDMTAGTRFSEDYDDPDSDVNLYECAAGWRPPASDRATSTC